MKVVKGGIAFFDSGIGGLTVLNSCRKILKDEIIYYYGDNKRAPYGNLPNKQIERYVNKAFKLFEKLKVKAVVIACNTATAVCVDKLRKKYSFEIIGAEPAVLAAARKSDNVLVLTTKATYNSARFSNLCARIKEEYPNVKLTLRACDDLAGEIEIHVLEKNYRYQNILPRENPSIVVLGCTHYIYIKEAIQTFYRCPTIDGNDGIANRLQLILTQKAPTKTKFWDERPLGVNWRQTNIKPRLVNIRNLKGIDTNKCSWLSIPAIRNKKAQIYFLGSGKRQNKCVYEHMFEF